MAFILSEQCVRTVERALREQDYDTARNTLREVFCGCQDDQLARALVEEANSHRCVWRLKQAEMCYWLALKCLKAGLFIDHYSAVTALYGLLFCINNAQPYYKCAKTKEPDPGWYKDVYDDTSEAFSLYGPLVEQSWKALSKGETRSDDSAQQKNEEPVLTDWLLRLFGTTPKQAASAQN